MFLSAYSGWTCGGWASYLQPRKPFPGRVQPASSFTDLPVSFCADGKGKAEPAARGQRRIVYLRDGQHLHRRAENHRSRGLHPPGTDVGEGQPPDSHHRASAGEPWRSHAPYVPRDSPRIDGAPRCQGALPDSLESNLFGRKRRKNCPGWNVCTLSSRWMCWISTISWRTAR